MGRYSSLLHDRSVQWGAPATILTAMAPFLSAAATGIPWAWNLAIAAVVLASGVGLVAWRARRVSGISAESDGSVVAEETRLANQVDGDGTEEGPQVPPATQGPGAELAAPTSDSEDARCWKIVEPSVRKIPVASGEGPIVLMGYAEVEAEGDDEYNMLYYCSMFNVDTRENYYEFRTASSWARISRRECEVRLLPGEVVAYERTWPSDGEPFNNVLCDSKSAKDETRGLLADSERLVFVWTDTIEHQNGQQQKKTRRLVVTTDGLADAADRFQWAQALRARRFGLF